MSKIKKTVPLEPNDRPDDWVIPIVNTIPRGAYKYVQNGYESDGSINVMIVLEDGVDEQELMKSPVTSSDKTLTAIGRDICTPGIWPSFDSLGSPKTFWKNSQGVASRLQEWNEEHAKGQGSLS
ncbi:hypothetical protein NLJ89_g3824 [Agrocybe chaxingu]|uniref:Uncharacterized protein n=1 Tax=Agrocybe chaxingu TaxID=84603 RepID=A0A9W8MYC1_9AGAR|nr:hypothetical protein NLJ89_g3824 [Agrocybe chaxingu]